MLKAIKLTRDAGQEATLYLGGEFPPGQRLTENLLALITELELSDAVIRLGHISRAELQATAERCLVGVFPFDEGFSSKRSSLASICHCELPLVVGAGSDEEHPFLAPEQNTAAALSVLLVELFSGKLEEIWEEQVKAQRLFASHFSFSSIAQSHLQLYQRLRSIDV